MTLSSSVRSDRAAAAGALMLAALLSAPAHADPAPVPQGVVGLTASAALEVTKDVLSMTLGTTREGADAGTVQTQLKQALDAALTEAMTEAKRAASPGQLDVRTGSFNISPRYNSKGAANGWQGSAELVVEGRDMQAIGQLAGRITSLTVAQVGYDISRELREKSEAEVSAQAIARYRARAADYARQFGYASYTIREVTVSTSDSGSLRPMPMRAMKALSVTSDEPLPIEPGKGTVTVSVSGSVQMNR